jgi:hypothetical protein
MTTWKRAGVSTAAFATLAMLLAGCSTTSSQPRAMAQPEQLTPIGNSQVASSNLPAIGQNGQVVNGQMQGGTRTAATPENLNPALTGTPVLGGNQPMQTAATDPSFVSLDAVGTVPNSPGRNLTGGLSVQTLLGGWTIVSGAEQCRLNLTQTAKEGTSRYRASTPACNLQGLNAVASWQLAGSQVQLFDEGGSMIAALILSGNRFIGTLAGGQGISMVG